MKYAQCHFAIPERFRGRRILSWRQLAGHMAAATFQGIAGEFDVPDWWIDRGMRS